MWCNVVLWWVVGWCGVGCSLGGKKNECGVMLCGGGGWGGVVWGVVGWGGVGWSGVGWGGVGWGGVGWGVLLECLADRGPLRPEGWLGGIHACMLLFLTSTFEH